MSSLQSTPHGRLPLLVLGAALVLATACSPSGVLDPARATDPSAAQLAKGGKGGGGSDGALMGTIVTADHFAGAAEPLASTCATVVKVGQWHLDFGSPSPCLQVTLTWNTDPGSNSFHATPYALTDEVKLVVRKESGKNGRITHVRLLGQDVVGDAGIGHNTDEIPVAEPVVPDKAGFTLHVHAASVPVYRLDSHLFGGNRVALIGWVSIGDAVYSPE